MGAPHSLFRLPFADKEIILRAVSGCLPEIVYLGPLLDPDLSSSLWESAIAHGGLDETEPLSVCPVSQTGFSGSPGLEVSLPDPAAVVSDVQVIAENTKLSITAHLFDHRLIYQLSITATGETLSFQAALENISGAPLQIARFAPTTLPVSGESACLIGGYWGHEWQMERSKIGAASLISENRTGRTSHSNWPGLIIEDAGCREITGTCIGLHVAWSGNHRLGVHCLRDGRAYVQAEELFWQSALTLNAGETYTAPEIIIAVSEQGRNGLRQAFQSTLRARVRHVHGEIEQPVILNTWEAVYFDHDIDKLCELARAAADLGIELFVLDDGWFGRRRSDQVGLGDWTPSPDQFPDGLTPLIECVKANGMQFGLWVEPEMVNRDSRLYEDHPDWILGGPDQLLGRHQYALDLSNSDAFEHIAKALEDLLETNPIDFLKWDMNRDLPAVRTDEQVRVLYRLQRQLRDRFPDVRIEACASGGGRADYKILETSSRIWLSDAHDPDIRLNMLKTASLFFPPEILGTHIGAAKSHLTGRVFSWNSRLIAAMQGHMGLELDVTQFSERERDRLKSDIGWYKSQRDWCSTACLYALDDIGDHAHGLIHVSPSGDQALVTYFVANEPPTSVPGRLKAAGLDPDRAYRVAPLYLPSVIAHQAKHQPSWLNSDALIMSGATFMQLGLPIPILRAGQGFMISLKAED